MASERTLEQTPTWAVATVCAAFVMVSLLVERGIHVLGRYLKRTKQKPLYHTLEKLKEELMVLGFISLAIAVFQPLVARICMPEHISKYMLPCTYEPPVEAPAATPAAARRLFQTAATTSSTEKCPAGKVQIISAEGLHQLHIFIFVMAVVQVFYTCVTVLAGLWLVHSWSKWEVEARQEDNKCVKEALEHKHKKAGTDFISNRIMYKFLQTSRTGLNLDSYVYSFFRQFGKPIYKPDYLCLRLGFITKNWFFDVNLMYTWWVSLLYLVGTGHLQTHQLDRKYDFHSYIRRSMEYDFKVVVGISWYLWAFVCAFLLLNIRGWYTYFWLAFIPVVLVLLVGAKLQQIIVDLALEVRGGVQKIETTLYDLNGHVIPQQEKLVCHPIRPRDDLFWFSRPRLLLYLVQFILFQNAFELAFFFWILVTFGFSSCIMGKSWMVAVRLATGVFVQILCSVSTLPLYALVSQLGSKIKFSVFKSEATAMAIHSWKNKAKKDHKKHIKEGIHHHDLESPREKHLGIIGLNKGLDKQGLPHNLEPSHANRAHNGHEDGAHHKIVHGGEHHKHPAGSHSVEISEQPQDHQEVPTSYSYTPMPLAAVSKILQAKKRRDLEDNVEEGDHNDTL